MAYRLHRVDGVVELPAWWNVGGTAFHECVREWETLNHASTEPGSDWPAPPGADEQAERFRHHLAEQTAATVLASGVSLSAWRTGGRASTQYPQKENREWWLDNGPEMVARYVTAALARESHIETVSTGFAVEVEFMWRPTPHLPQVKGFVDQVHRYPNGDLLIRDLKSGSHRPVDPLQLMLYRLALEDEFGLTAPKWYGDYWMARKGEPSRALDLTDRVAVGEQVYNRLAIMDGAERAGFYLPSPSSLCSACGVRAACPAMGDPSTARPWSVPVLTGN